MDNAKQNLETLKTSFIRRKIKLIRKADTALQNQVQKLKDELPDFDIKVPTKDELAILLYDTEKFAGGGTKVKISSVTTKTPQSIEIIDPENHLKRKFQ